MQVKRECNLAHWACHTPVYISIGPVLWNVNVERHSQFCTDFFSLRNKREGERGRGLFNLWENQDIFSQNDDSI